MAVWLLVLLISVPALLFGYWRYRWIKRRFGKRAAGTMAGFFIAMLCVGIYHRHRALEAYQQENPQGLRYSANPLVRQLFTPNAAPLTVTDDANGQEVFTYYRNDGAARLTALAHAAPHEWMATLSINASEPQNAQLKGYLEAEVTDDARVLPLTRAYRAWGGAWRVEDVQTGQTLFSYDAAGAFRPVEASKQATAAGVYAWQVRFTTAAGLLSQQAEPARN